MKTLRSLNSEDLEYLRKFHSSALKTVAHVVGHQKDLSLGDYVKTVRGLLPSGADKNARTVRKAEKVRKAPFVPRLQKRLLFPEFLSGVSKALFVLGRHFPSQVSNGLGDLFVRGLGLLHGVNITPKAVPSQPAR